MEQVTETKVEPQLLTSNPLKIADPGKYRVVEERYHNGEPRPFLSKKRGRDSDLSSATSRFRSACKTAFVELDQGQYSTVTLYDDKGKILDGEKVTP